MSSTVVDDKTPICVPFILEHLKAHNGHRPFFIGLNGIQGAGKTTLVKALAAALEAERVHTLVCSIDDFYLNHDDLVALAREHPDNALVQHRGEPGMEPPGHLQRQDEI
jgi:D-glycerate 3-kinase